MFLLIPSILIVIGLNLMYWKPSFGSLTFTGISALTLFISILILIDYQVQTATMPVEREALQQSYDSARQHSDFERLAITKDIAEFNRELAENKYWNDTVWFGVFYNDVIEDVKPIK